MVHQEIGVKFYTIIRFEDFCPKCLSVIFKVTNPNECFCTAQTSGFILIKFDMWAYLGMFFPKFCFISQNIRKPKKQTQHYNFLKISYNNSDFICSSNDSNVVPKYPNKTYG